MKPRSKSLFHFTKTEGVLKEILTDGFWPHYCLENISWQGNKDFEVVAYPMTCFCDIPLSRINNHINSYGGYGIGLNQDWALKKKLNPLTYLAGNSTFHNALKGIANLLRDIPNPYHNGQALALTRHMVSYLKPVTGSVEIDGQHKNIDFYQESEWRYIPTNHPIKEFLTGQEFADLGIRNQENLVAGKYGRLHFLPTDINYIFVPAEKDISLIIEFIEKESTSHDKSWLELKLKIRSIERMQEDN